MALLRTPTEHVPWVDGLKTEVAPDLKWHDEKTTEGQIEVSLEAAVALGMLLEGDALYGAWQVRAAAPLPESWTAILKAMVWVDPNLATGIRVREGAIKVKWRTCRSAIYQIFAQM